MKNRYPFPESSTMESLRERLWSDEGFVCRYGDYVLAAAHFWAGGYVAAIYRFVETPESTGLGECECMLSLCEKSPEAFADGGHALAWALAGVNRGELKVVDLSKTQKAALLEIARQQMVSVELRGDLEEHENDAEDWLEVSVWGLRSALEQAYLLGLEDARK